MRQSPFDVKKIMLVFSLKKLRNNGAAQKVEKILPLPPK